MSLGEFLKYRFYPWVKVLLYVFVSMIGFVIYQADSRLKCAERSAYPVPEPAKPISSNPNYETYVMIAFGIIDIICIALTHFA